MSKQNTPDLLDGLAGQFPVAVTVAKGDKSEGVVGLAAMRCRDKKGNSVGLVELTGQLPDGATVTLAADFSYFQKAWADCVADWRARRIAEKAEKENAGADS